MKRAELPPRPRPAPPPGPGVLRNALGQMAGRTAVVDATRVGHQFTASCTFDARFLRGRDSEVIGRLEGVLRDLNRQACSYVAASLGEMEIAGAPSVDVEPSVISEGYEITRYYAVVFPRHNPSYARSRASANPGTRPPPDGRLHHVGTTSLRDLANQIELQQLLAADDCALWLLTTLAREIGAVGDRARRHPSMPTSCLREAMAAGSWDAWLNPSAALVLLGQPGDDLERGAAHAAMDALGINLDQIRWRGLAQGLSFGVYQEAPSLRVVLDLRERCHGRGHAERDVLDALETLWRPILGRG